MSRSTSRRRFLQASALAGAGFWSAGSTPLRAQDDKKLRFACIGVGGKGESDSRDASRHGDIVAICDIDAQRLDKAGERYTDAKKYYDFRTMLEEMAGEIDAVTVSTPDHTHAPAAALAMSKGKHCFTQKPLTHSIWEARRLGEIAAEKGVATQMGNQGTANSGLREAAAQVQAGAIGAVAEVHVWTNRPVWPQGLARPEKAEEVPAHLHWEEFIGPAPFRPYHSAYHPFKWRGWWDFGTGALGDMACHTLNLPYFALQLRDPTSVVAETSGHNKETYPAWSVITFEFPALGDRPAVKLVWYDGGKLPPEALLQGAKMQSSGSLMVGSQGSIYAPGDYAGNYEMLGGAKKLDGVEFTRSPGHFEEWIQAIRGGAPAMSNFPGYGGPLTETILLGNLAVWADGKKIEWDAKSLQATNAPEVADIVKPKYREGYDFL